MGEKLRLDDKDYDLDNLSEHAISTLESLKFVTARLQELDNMRAIFQRAKNSYAESLKKEMLSIKAGFFLDDD
jgi:tRNA C32,U32 (ribose-2'-O)-methylase TrmJ